MHEVQRSTSDHTRLHSHRPFHLPFDRVCQSSLVSYFILLWFETIQEGCKCLQEEREKGGRAFRPRQSLCLLRARRLGDSVKSMYIVATFIMKKGEMNLDQKGAARGQIPIRVGSRGESTFCE